VGESLMNICSQREYQYYSYMIFPENIKKIQRDSE